jgi:hypothetical protein
MTNPTGSALTATEPSQAVEREAAVPGGERGWLIELATMSGPEWWSLSDPNNWTKDSRAALRFARKEDAELYAAEIGWTETFASEHIWCDPAPAKEPPIAPATSASTARRDDWHYDSQGYCDNPGRGY